VTEAADTVGGDHTVAGNHDRQPVVAAALADGARIRTQLARQLAVGARAAAGNRAHRVPDAALQLGSFDQQRQVERGVGIVAVALELLGCAFSQRRSGWNGLGGQRQILDLDHALIPRLHADLELRELDDYVVHSFSIC